MPRKHTLNERQRRFVLVYVETRNATEAAKEAGYSAKTAGQIGSRLLKNVKVQSEIEKKLGRAMAKRELSIDNVLEEVRRIAFADIGALFDEQGRLRPINELAPETRALISSVEVVKRRELPSEEGEGGVEEYVHKVKLWDKGAQLGNAMKYLGLLVEAQQHLHIHVTDEQLRERAMKLIEGK